VLRIAHRVGGPATGESQTDSRITLEVTSVTVSGQVYPLSATVDVPPVAVRRASRDGVVVKAGTLLLIVLREGLTVGLRREDAPAGHATVSPATN